MTDVNQVINVTVNVGDVSVTAVGFGTPLILDQFAGSVFGGTGRVRTYTSLVSVGVDFATTSKVYKAAQAIFAQERAPTKLKVGRKDSGDASFAAALDAITNEDNDWYCLIAVDRVKANIQAIALNIEARKKIYLASSEDSDVIAAGSTDIASLLKAAGYKRTAYMWHHQAGVDATGASYTITGGVATITKTAHGLLVGDPVTFSASSGTSIDGDNTVASVPTANTFTIATSAANFVGPGTVTYFARYTFPEAAWAGSQLSSDPGSETWKFKQLAGIATAPRTALTPAQETIALGKNANLYTDLGGVGFTHEGVMSGGRYIDIERGIDWLEQTIETTIVNRLLNEEKIPYTDAGATIIHGDIASVLDEGVRRLLLGPLLDGSGKFYVITIPKVAAQLTSDRQARNFPGITARAQLAGAVHSLAITVNAAI
jgi:hypothetical protein